MADDGKWFAAKTAYRTVTRDARGVVTTLVEERVVLLHAASPEEASRLGEDEARAYVADPPFSTRDGAPLDTQYLGTVDVFALPAGPQAGTAVYSGMYTLPGEVDATAVVARSFGPAADDALSRRADAGGGDGDAGLGPAHHALMAHISACPGGLAPVDVLVAASGPDATAVGRMLDTLLVHGHVQRFELGGVSRFGLTRAGHRYLVERGLL